MKTHLVCKFQVPVKPKITSLLKNKNWTAFGVGNHEKVRVGNLENLGNQVGVGNPEKW
jgi:hypothetical protein